MNVYRYAQIFPSNSKVLYYYDSSIYDAVCTLMDVVCTSHCVYHGNVLVFRFGKKLVDFFKSF